MKVCQVSVPGAQGIQAFYQVSRKNIGYKAVQYEHAS